MDGVLPKYYFSGEFADFQEELERLPHKKVCFRPGDVLWNAGEPVLYTYYFRKGFVQAYVEHEDGHRKILSFHKCGTIYPGFQKTDFKIEKSILVHEHAIHHKIQAERTGRHLFPLKQTA